MKSWLMMAVTATPLLCACHGSADSGTEVPDLAGPCEVTVEEPIINIDAVTSGELDLEIVVLSNLVIDGVRQDLLQEVELGWINIEADLTEDSLLCTLPCGFSEIEGQYSFTVSAEGFGSAPFWVDAAYESFDGGCPATYNGGVHLELSLPPA